MNKGIEINVSLKHAGNIAKRVKIIRFPLKKYPSSLRELIEECVTTSLEEYKSRGHGKKDGIPLTEGEFAEMQNVGKFAFGVHYNTGEISEESAVKTALEAFSDGLVRILKNDTELKDLDAKIEISDGDVFTFVRLTMLSGRLW